MSTLRYRIGQDRIFFYDGYGHELASLYFPNVDDMREESSGMVKELLDKIGVLERENANLRESLGAHAVECFLP